MNLDLVTGALSNVLQLFASPAADTIAGLDVYRGIGLEALFPAPVGIPEVRITDRWRAAGVVSEDVVFASQHEPLEPAFRERYRAEYAENHTVYARRLRPAGSAGRPRILYLHGYLQPETYLEEVALLASAARLLDVEIVQLQPPYHGRRTPRGSTYGGELYWTADLVRSFEALRQSLLDARTLLGWMLEEEGGPVGIMGLSLGGALTLALTCLEDRFAFSIPLIAHMDLAAMVADAPVLGRMRRELREFGWGADEFRSFVTETGWYGLAPKLPPSRIRLFAASDDLFFDEAVVGEMWRAWGEPPIRWYPTSHMGFLTQLPWVLGDIRTFVDEIAAAPASAG